MDDIHHEILKRAALPEPSVVATVVRTKGSTPREVGAKMVIGADGTSVGTIGGGCGEAEVWSRSLDVLETGVPEMVEVDLVSDLDGEGGRACGGIMYVFLERIDPEPAPAA